MNTNSEYTLKLSDGRSLVYAEYGAPAGKPIFYFHGSPGSRLDPQMLDQDCLVKFNARLISPDRPGMGLSDFRPNRNISDWPEDVSALADALGLQRFAVLGHSGGGPYAEVCALKIPQRLTAVAVVSGVGPLDAPEATQGMGTGRFLLKAARLHPRLGGMFLGMMKSSMRYAKMSEMPGMPPPDMEILAQPEFATAFQATAEESWRRDVGGSAWDATIVARPWDFQLEAIKMPVHLWHGGADRNAPVAMGRFVAQSIPGCLAKFYPDEGHLSLLRNHLDEVLQVLVG
jgi:pimeloyl-ACP methyl ester carboxylesterase